jgi:hypothetical protein
MNTVRACWCWMPARWATWRMDAGFIRQADNALAGVFSDV